jgi:crotonobetainyl-CoA:carnitine CoA-transferase CaiB-like acyl-CoA transferase
MSRKILNTIWDSLHLDGAALSRLAIQNSDNLSSVFPVTDLAVGAIGAAALAISELIGEVAEAPPVDIDRRRASLWFGWSIQPLGWEMPAAWDAIAGDYRSADGWIRLHTNAPHHRAAAPSVLECAGDRANVPQAVATWSAEELESAVVAAGGCAAAMRSMEAWAQHPQSKALAAEPLIAFTPIDAVPSSTDWRPCDSRPLSGLKILDLTRVLAGPVATRLLAGYGANVLRVDPPDWDEAGVIPEVTLGKRCARLDLHRSADRASFECLLAEADVLVHGYRPGALDALGYSEAERRDIKPDLIDVSLDAYGWSGPWKGRRGFDSLVQMSAGIADAGMKWKHADRPTPLPVQALDHATGYMMAAAVIWALIRRQKGEGVATARLSLARTAKLLVDMQADAKVPAWAERTDADLAPGIEQTAWGPAGYFRRSH